MRKFIRPALRFILILAAGCVALVLTQDLQIFPGALSGLISQLIGGKNETPPAEVKSGFVETTDGKKINYWYLPANGPNQEAATPQTAIIFHGNAGTLRAFYGIQTWFRDLGIGSYSFDYRGFGESTGWPSEKGLSLDGEAVWNLMVKEENLSPQQIIVFGISLGTGPAAQIASSHQAGTLILLSPYTSLPELVRERSWLRFFAPFLWYKLPTSEYVKKLRDSCLIIAHGKKDGIIPFTHSARLLKQLRGHPRLFTVLSEKGNHNDLFHMIKPELAKQLARCEGPGSNPGSGQ